MAVRWLRVARAVFIVSGRPTFGRVSGLVAAVGIVGAIVFGGSGVRPGDVVRMFHHSVAVRAALLAAWTLMATPAVAPALDAPGTNTLRSLSLPSVPLLGSLLVLFACAELPWTALFAAGGGVGDGVAACAMAVALQAALLSARSRRHTAWLIAPALAVAAWDPPAAVMSLLALPLATVSVLAAWTVSPERGRAARRILRPMPALLALPAAHLLLLIRGERARLSLGAMSAAVGAAFLSLSLRNDVPERPLPRGVLVMALPVALAAAVLVGPVLKTESRFRPWARSLRVRTSVVVFAFVIAIGMPSTALAAGAGAIAGALGGASPASLASGLAVASLTLAAAIAGWGRVHARTRKRNAVVFAIGVLVIATVTMGAAAAW